MTGRAWLALMLIAGACTPPPAPAPAPAAQHGLPRPPTPVPLPEGQRTVTQPLPPAAGMLAIHWWRSSAERTALFLQGYALASERVRAAAPALPRGGWAVILDGDETTLDNSTYQLRRNGQNLGYSSESWAAWVREKAAPATPGAAAFTHLVRQLGGRVVIVTNRDDEVCPETRENLQRVQVEFDLVLCRVNRVSDKGPRFQAVQNGSGTGLPPLRVVLWVGDNIQDFPGGAQALLAGSPASLAEVGRSWVILPNPMYGSWESLPLN